LKIGSLGEFGRSKRLEREMREFETAGLKCGGTKSFQVQFKKNLEDEQGSLTLERSNVQFLDDFG